MSDDTMEWPRLADETLTRGDPHAVPLYHPRAVYTVDVKVAVAVNVSFGRPFDEDEWRRVLLENFMDRVQNGHLDYPDPDEDVSWDVMEVRPEDDMDDDGSRHLREGSPA